MCRRVDCSDCGKPTYSGCGMHVEQVLGTVPREDRCKCRDESSEKSQGSGQGTSLFRRIFGL